MTDGLLRDRKLSLLLVLGACAAGPAAVLHFMGGREVHIASTVHFLPIAVSAGLAALAAAALTVAGARRGDGRSVIVGTAFSTMAGLLAVHGLTTPGMLVEANGVVAFSGAATLPVGGAVLALAAVPELRRPAAVRPLLWAQAILLGGVVALGAAGIALPALVPSVPEPDSPAAIAVLVLGLGFYGVIAVRAARTYLLTRRRADLLVVLGLAVLAVAVVPALLMSYLELGWWLGHLFELIGLGLVAVPVALDLHRDAQSRPLAGDLRGTELVVAADAFLGPQVHALLRRLAEKDAYTAEHTQSVALLAVRVGEELGLPPARLRELAIGALMHDIGKLAVPDAILQKPGPLTDGEFEAIRRHPDSGRELVLQLGLGRQVARLVSDHHERLDGSGYPRGVGGAELDLETRVLMVCDVFDALLSARVYRRAWRLDRALGLLRAEAGTTLDPRCVWALEWIVAREGGSLERLAGRAGEPATQSVA